MKQKITEFMEPSVANLHCDLKLCCLENYYLLLKHQAPALGGLRAFFSYIYADSATTKHVDSHINM